jgi:hypothetical protein
MVEFGNGYFMPMDREYGHTDIAHAQGSPAANSTNDVNIPIGEIGMSLGLGPVPNVQAVGAKLRAGTKTVELVFMGSGKGSGQGHTPGMYGLKQRAALVEMGKANQIDYTTHSTVGVFGVAGMDQQGNFSKQSKEAALNEVRRAVEFAGDVAKGGPVVVHTGEFQRPAVDAEWNQKNDGYRNKFKLYDGEEERAAYRVVDTRTGGVIQEARKNRKVARPVWNVSQEGMEYEDFDGNKRVSSGELDGNGRPIYLDYFGKRLRPEDRVPMYDEEKGQFMTRQLGWNELKEEAHHMTARAKEVWNDWKSGKISQKEFDRSYWVRFRDAENEKDINVRPEEAYIISTFETNAANSRGWAYYYGADFDQSVEDIKKLREAKKFYERIEEETDEDEKWKLKQQLRSRYGDLIPPDSKFPSQVLKESLRQAEHKMKQGQEASSSQWSQAEESMESIRHVESAETYAQKEAYDSYAQLGIKAWEQTKRLKEQGDYKKPIQMAMENLFPETYGAHPDELRNLVEGSRKKMASLLKQRGMKEEEAKKKAEEHITATFDTGHLNMWRKYWQGDPNKTIAQNDKDFDNWMVSKIEGLAKDNIIGHIHLVDNFGYQDDHVAPGEGNAPIKEMLKVLKKNGYKGEMIVEPGADYTMDVSGFHSVMKTWRNFGSSVYGLGSGLSAPTGRTWEQVGYGHFGQNQPPYFAFGGYSPSEDWTLWSGVQLE